MSSDGPAPAAAKNRLLAKISEAEASRILPLLMPINLPANLVLYEMHGPIRYVYFPTGAALSALTVMEDGSMIEVATIGNEGLVGHTTAFGGKTSPFKIVVQIAGSGLRVEATALRAEIDRSHALRELMANYQSAFMMQVSQSVACNGLHRLEQRCCRWLLMSRDRVGTDELRLTHEYLGIMLGARRSSLTDVLKPLQDAKLVRSHRGLISILDGAGLEERACECYQIVKAEYDRLLGKPPGEPPGEP